MGKSSFRGDEREPSNSQTPSMKTELHFKYNIKNEVAKNYRITIAEYIHKSIIKMISIKGALSSLKMFLASKSTLKVMKNVFYFTLKVLFVLKISQVLS